MTIGPVEPQMKADDGGRILIAHHNMSKSMTATVLIGIGLMAAVDEIVFHQILSWHHFYDRTTPAVALLSDGLLHSAELILLVAGFFMLSNLRSERLFSAKAGLAGLFMGLGGFQLFDGLIDHKVLRLHQIRYGVDNLWMYDIIWNAAGAILLLAGLLMAKRARSTSPAKR